MKKIFIILFLFSSCISIAQDTALFSYINEYRKFHWLCDLEWSDYLYKKTIKVVDGIDFNNNLNYSTSELCYIKLYSLPLYAKNKKTKESSAYHFNKFTTKYFRDKYIPGKLTPPQLNKIISYFILYNWHLSYLHRELLLSNHYFGACHIKCEFIEYRFPTSSFEVPTYHFKLIAVLLISN